MLMTPGQDRSRALSAEGWKREPLLQRPKAVSDHDVSSRPHIFRLPLPRCRRRSEDSISTCSSHESHQADNRGTPAFHFFDTVSDVHEEAAHPSTSSKLKNPRGKSRQKVTFRLPARHASRDRRKNLHKTDKLHVDLFSFLSNNDESVADAAKNHWVKCRAAFGTFPSPAEPQLTHTDFTSDVPSSGRGGECDFPGVQELPGKDQVCIPSLSTVSPGKWVTHEDKDLAELVLLFTKLCGGLKGWLDEHHPDFSPGRQPTSQIVSGPTVLRKPSLQQVPRLGQRSTHSNLACTVKQTMLEPDGGNLVRCLGRRSFKGALSSRPFGR
mmetsp:Transcript_14054/g.24700  ORF Transcript_14054/g.24700 Transcript_14054/m.24700 type:complete len:325 (+) Transcript_14054:505-1479(+)